MGVPAAGQVVVVPFPYSDLSDRKNRPAVLIAPAGNGDWVICQITSNPFSDPRAIKLSSMSFTEGGLHHVSFVRPSKLFTANHSIVLSQAGVLPDEVLARIRDAIVNVVQPAE